MCFEPGKQYPAWILKSKSWLTIGGSLWDFHLRGVPSRSSSVCPWNRHRRVWPASRGSVVTWWRLRLWSYLFPLCRHFSAPSLPPPTCLSTNLNREFTNITFHVGIEQAKITRCAYFCSEIRTAQYIGRSLKKLRSLFIIEELYETLYVIVKDFEHIFLSHQTVAYM